MPFNLWNIAITTDKRDSLEIMKVWTNGVVLAAVRTKLVRLVPITHIYDLPN